MNRRSVEILVPILIVIGSLAAFVAVADGLIHWLVLVPLVGALALLARVVFTPASDVRTTGAVGPLRRARRR